MQRRLIFLIICLLTVTLSFAEDRKKNVLVVCPYSLAGTWAKNTIEPITELDKNKMNITFSVMRNSSFKNVGEMEEREQMIYRNLDSKRPDLIIIFGPGNYILADDFNRKWKNVPMILTGELNYVCDKEYICDSVSRANVRRTPLSTFAKGKNITFIHTPVYYRETTELMRKAIPQMRTVIFLGGEEYVSREIEQNMILAVKDLGRSFKAYHPDDINFHELANILSTTNRTRSAFIYCNWHDKEGLRDVTQPTEGVRPALEKLVPLFNTFYSNFDGESKTAGFISYNHDEFIKKMKSAVSAIMSGKKTANEIPFIEIRMELPVLNYKVLDIMGLNPESIKGDIKFVNTPKTIWEKYRLSLLLLTIILLTILTLFTFYLYKKQHKLLKSSALYYALINNAPFNYNRSKLLFDSHGVVTDIITKEVNLTLQNSSKEHGTTFGRKTLMESYPQSTPTLIRQINDARKEKKKTIRFTFHLKEYNCYYEMLILLDRSDIIHVFSLNTTELMNTQKELMIAKEKAELSDKMKTAFVQNVSHEIRTPLNAVVGFSQLLTFADDNISQEEREKYNEYIQDNSDLLMMLVDDILAISDIERGEIHINQTEVLCNNVCQKAMRTVETRVPYGVNMYFTTELADDFMILSDSNRIQQVLINFLTNACKHTEKGEIHIHCSLSENPDMVTFSVTDTGEGVPVEMAEKIFERFTQVNSFKQGVGLGLNICRNIATKLNGEVKLDTTYTNGARFLFILPVVKKSENL